MSGFTFRPAIRTQTPLLLGLAGPSRSGKTLSALRLASGMGGDIFMIDTERGRGLHYADKYKYNYAELLPPFTSARYIEVIQAAKDAGAKIIIVDSASHEHEGPGGMLEQHEAFLDRTCGTDFKKRERMTFTAWIKPKAEHNKFVNALLQMGADTHFIFCFRAKDKLILKKGEEPIHAGWTPICSSRFEFEMTSLLVLPDGSKGTPDLQATAAGLREPLDQIFKPGVQLTEESGRKLAQWAAGGQQNPAARSAEEVVPPSPPGPLPSSAGPIDTAPIVKAFASIGVDQAALEELMAKPVKDWIPADVNEARAVYQSRKVAAQQKKEL